MFAAFNMFWTVAPIMLAERFSLDGHGIALFALAGAGGALAAPLAGRLADRGLGQITTAGAMAALGAAFFATGWITSLMLTGLVVLTIIIDAAVQTTHVVSQRIIFSVPAEVRGRVNALYMTFTFAGGAVGSVLGTVTYHWGGWTTVAMAGGIIGALSLLLFTIELCGHRHTSR
jgi:predicted MFS family arabinose efflux permease